jgi:hypothetical protein
MRLPQIVGSLMLLLLEFSCGTLELLLLVVLIGGDRKLTDVHPSSFIPLAGSCVCKLANSTNALVVADTDCTE